MFEQVLSAAMNGILLGGVLALLAFGLNLIFGVVKIIHMAYGQFVMLGLYLIYVLTMQLRLPLVFSALIAVFAMAILGSLTQLLVIGPLLGAPRLNQLLALAGLIIVLENLAMVIWGADYRGIPLYLPILNIGNFYIRGSCLFAFLGALITLGLLYLFLNKTYVGLSIRATAQDTEIAKLMGVNSRLVYFITLAAGGA
ncbi:MAG: branched-chain amino acid ABC transporter permease, partial [Candidatus Thorarchaeota archaeon]|nr:branched-chain amino acid ABC transporter permease [Candidatus Thorarchaeota archaeon]